MSFCKRQTFKVKNVELITTQLLPFTFHLCYYGWKKTFMSVAALVTQSCELRNFVAFSLWLQPVE